MNPMLALAVAFVSFVSGTFCLAVLRPILAQRQLVDVPNHRSSHSQPTVRGGGLGIAVGLLLGLGTGSVQLAASPPHVDGIAAVGFTVTALALVGFVEDTVGLGVRIRLAAQALVFGIASTGLVLAHNVPVLLGFGVWLAGVFYVNAANFMDGVNGVSSMHGAVTGAYFAFAGFVTDEPALMLSGAAVSAAFLSFLPWNAPRARMFMGDVGSYVLGGSVWALSVWSLVVGASLVTAIAPLFIYSIDVTCTLARRARRGAKLTLAHREHTYQQLQQKSNSHMTATLTVTAATTLCAVLGVWGLLVPDVTVWVVAAAVFIAAFYLLSPTLAARATHTPSRSQNQLRSFHSDRRSEWFDRRSGSDSRSRLK